MRVLATVAVIGCVIGGAGAVIPAYAATTTATPALQVGGEVSAPTTYSAAQLAALPQVTYTVTDGGKKVTDTGVLLTTLVTDAQPAYPASVTNTKNEFLRDTVTVRSASGYAVTFALGELTANYGNHPALLALTSGGKPTAGGPELVVPGDRTTVRFAHRITSVTVGVATAPVTDTAAPANGPVDVIDGAKTVVLTRAQLAALPQEKRTVSFSGMSGMETRTEAGPSLLDVLAAAHVKISADTWVAASATDNYAAVVTPDEQAVGGRTLMFSLVQDGAALARPRLVPDGDFYGDRLVSRVVDLYVGTGPAS